MTTSVAAIVDIQQPIPGLLSVAGLLDRRALSRLTAKGHQSLFSL